MSLDFDEGALTISQFIELYPFSSRSQCLLWLVFSYIQLFQQFPTQVLPDNLALDLAHAVPPFKLDERLFNVQFQTLLPSNSFTLPGGENSELASELKVGIESIISSWDDDSRAQFYLLQLIEIVHHLEGAKSRFRNPWFPLF